VRSEGGRSERTRALTIGAVLGWYLPEGFTSEFGSTACTWKGHRLILTAEHVTAKAEPKDLAFLLRVDEAINWEGMGKPQKVVERVSLPVERIVRCEALWLDGLVCNLSARDG
jgi:hypothetical protein